MSRYQIPSTKEEYTIYVGWDPPLNTFFAQIYGPGGEEGTDEGPIVWLGSLPPPIHDLAQLSSLISYYADIPDDIRRQLLADSD